MADPAFLHRNPMALQRLLITGQTERTDTHIIFTGTENCDLFMPLPDEIIRHTEALLHIIYRDKRIIILIFFSQKTYRT